MDLPLEGSSADDAVEPTTDQIPDRRPAAEATGPEDPPGYPRTTRLSGSTKVSDLRRMLKSGDPEQMAEAKSTLQEQVQKIEARQAKAREELFDAMRPKAPPPVRPSFVDAAERLKREAEVTFKMREESRESVRIRDEHERKSWDASRSTWRPASRRSPSCRPAKPSSSPQ